MKKVTFLVVLFFCISGVGFTQSGWTIGDQAAFGHSWITDKPSNTKTLFHPKFELGRKAIYQFNHNSGLGFGTFFSSEGGSWEDNFLHSKTSFRINYIKIPVFADFHFGHPNSKIQPHLAFGSSVSFLVGGKQLTELNDAYIGSKSKKIIKNDVDAGMQASLGLTSQLWRGISINHDISYYHGFVNQELKSGSSFQNRSIYASMGLTITKDAFGNMKSNQSKEKFNYKYKNVPYKKKNVRIRN